MSSLPSSLLATIRADKHVYQPLSNPDAIRLINIEPADADTLVNCTVTLITKLTQSPPFHALSYCWGEELADKTILCNGETFKVTKNLSDALYHLRSIGVSRLWVDAICIDQNSIPERNQQVSIMKQIYQRAQVVHVWLGASQKGDPLALEVIQKISKLCCEQRYGSEVQHLWRQRLRNEMKPFEVVQNCAMPDIDDDSSRCWQALADFFHRPWFVRVWVVQEVQGCPSMFMHSGKHRIEWDLVALAACWILYSPGGLHIRRALHDLTGFLQADFMWHRFLETAEDVPFLRILDRGRNLKCTEPSDRIFAMLQHPIKHIPRTENEDLDEMSFQHPLGYERNPMAIHLGVKVDYAKTSLDVYREVVLASIRQLNTLEVLSHVREADKDRVGYPSWIPRWDAPSDAFVGPLRSFLYNAGHSRPPQLSLSPSWDTICLRGLQIGTIEHTSPFLTLHALESSNRALTISSANATDLLSLSRLLVRDIWQPARNVRQSAARRARDDLSTHLADFAAYLLSRLKGCQNTYIPLDGTWCDVCQTPVIDKSGTAGPIDSLKVMHCASCQNGHFDMCLTCYDVGAHCKESNHPLKQRVLTGLSCFPNHELLARLSALAVSGNSSRDELSAKHACYQRLFFTTSSELIGSGPFEMRPGDVIVVLYGGRVPFVLREIHGQLSLVGDCYVSGIMDGEALAWSADGRFLEKDFEIH